MLGLFTGDWKMEQKMDRRFGVVVVVLDLLVKKELRQMNRQMTQTHTHTHWI